METLLIDLTLLQGWKLWREWLIMHLCPFFGTSIAKAVRALPMGLRKSEFTSESIVVHMNVRANQ